MRESGVTNHRNTLYQPTVLKICKLSSKKVSFSLFCFVLFQEDDNSPPRCQVNNRSATCDAVYNLSTCSNMTWTAYTSVLDLGKGLLKITAKNSKLGKLNGMNGKVLTGQLILLKEK